MIKYLVTHGVSVVEFANLSAAQEYASLHALEAPIEFDEVVPPSAPVDMSDLVRRAIQHGYDVRVQFAAENVAMGITAAGKTKAVADLARDVMYYLQTGSLYEAATAVDLVDTTGMAPFLTPARMTQFKARIMAFFGS